MSEMSRYVYGHRDPNWGPVCHTLKTKVQGHNVWKHKETSYRSQDPSRNEKFSGSYWLHIYGMVIPPIFPLATMTNNQNREKHVRFLASRGLCPLKFLMHDWFVRWTTKGKKCDWILSSCLRRGTLRDDKKRLVANYTRSTIVLP